MLAKMMAKTTAKYLLSNILLATVIMGQNSAVASDAGETRELNTDPDKLCRLLYDRFNYALWKDVCSHSKGVVVPPFAIRSSHNVEDYDEVADFDINPKFRAAPMNDDLDNYDNNSPRLQGLARLVEVMRFKNILKQLKNAQRANDDPMLSDRVGYSILQNMGDSESPKYYRSFDDDKSHSDRAGEKDRRDDHEMNHPLYLI